LFAAPSSHCGGAKMDALEGYLISGFGLAVILGWCAEELLKLL
jgi:hypothetical protein